MSVSLYRPTANNRETLVVFKQPGAKAVALYKGVHATDNAGKCPSIAGVYGSSANEHVIVVVYQEKNGSSYR